MKNLKNYRKRFNIMSTINFAASDAKFIKGNFSILINVCD